jgi:hypothetical protein
MRGKANPAKWLLCVLLFAWPAQAGQTSIYVFDPSRSVVLQTGGLAGVQVNYSVKGRFLVTIDPNAGTAWFSRVDASLRDDKDNVYGHSLNQIFNMTGLTGAVVDDATIEFVGKNAARAPSDIRLTLTLTNDSAQLTGQITPPANSADMFIYQLDAIASREHDGGTGESNSPYLIYTAEQMNAIGAEPNEWDKHFKLMADIDLSQLRGADFNIIGYWRAWDDNASFSGVFDGDGHTISNFTYSCVDANRVGLFGYIDGTGAEIRNLGLIDPNVDAGTGRFVGSLIGELVGGKISGCFVQGGTIAGGQDVGGLVGYGDGFWRWLPAVSEIVNCYTITNVRGMERIGGLVGCNEGTIVSACFSTGSVSGMGIIGGLAGQNGNWYPGREGGLFVGGLIHDCYSACDVMGRTQVGGLVGFNYVGDISRCFSSGAVLDSEPNRSTDSNDGLFGGLVGDNDAGIKDCFWDVETSGLMVSAGGTGKRTAQMQTAGTFISWGACGSLWTIDESHDHPRLAWENMPGESILGPAYGGGAGTAEDPYLINTAEQLNMIGQNYCHWDKHFKLMADVNLSALDGKDGRPAFNVIGTDRWDAFSGVFDGNGHTISHLTLTGEDNVGMFGELGLWATVMDLGVVDVNIIGSGTCVGALVGKNYGDLIRCYSSGTVKGNKSVGGLAGASLHTNVFRRGVTESHSSCLVSGDNSVGGLVGCNSSSITRCRSTGAVYGDWRVGGLVGDNSGSVTHCYSTAVVSGSSSSSIGGLIGLDYDFNNFGYRDVSLSFWDIETSGQVTSDGGTGKTTAEMQTADTFLIWGTCGNEGNWTIDEGNDYPRLWWEDKPGEPIAVAASISGLLTGSGTEDSPYLIYTGDELNLIGLFPCDWDKHFKLMADIDLSGYSYDGAMIARQTAFTGVFDGNGHAISHLTITGMSYLGLFGELASGAEVKDLGVVDVNISGSGDVVGGLVGHSQRGTVVTRCYSKGTVNGDDNTGGLVGINSGRVTQCYSTVAVNGDYLVGGLLGTNKREGAVTNCYSTGAVSGIMTVGGLVGANYGSITATYSTGAVNGETRVGGFMGGNYEDGSVTSSFWDVETSGLPRSVGGIGKTTGEMQRASTFLEAGWDFVGETANGTQDIWRIDEGKDYPRLWWQAHNN